LKIVKLLKRYNPAKTKDRERAKDNPTSTGMVLREKMSKRKRRQEKRSNAGKTVPKSLREKKRSNENLEKKFYASRGKEMGGQLLKRHARLEKCLGIQKGHVELRGQRCLTIQ